MAGHSKWKNIQHRKGKQDAARGKLFTKLSKEIFVAVKNGGDDPETNAKLKQAIQKAKQNNMPNSNIENTIKKASGDVEGVNYEEILYEGYGPSGAAVMVECLTDNRNRTAAEIRHLFSKNGGNLGESGCVAYLFERKGIITLSKDHNQLDEETLMMQMLEAGAEDIQVEDGYAEIQTSPADLEQVKQSAEAHGYVLAQAEVMMVPATTVQLEGEDASKMAKLYEALDDNDDVQNVYTNVDLEQIFAD